MNGDTCPIGSFVIIRDHMVVGVTAVARVEEIIQKRGSIADLASQPDGIVLQSAIVSQGRPRYGMPSILLSGNWSIATIEVVLNFNSELRSHMDHRTFYAPSMFNTIVSTTNADPPAIDQFLRNDREPIRLKLSLLMLPTPTMSFSILHK